MKIFCRILSCILVVVICLALYSIGSDSRKPLSYKIIERNGEYFIKISGDPLPYDERISCRYQIAGLDYDSISEMTTKITEYKLIENEIDKMLVTFSKNENGEIPIFNIYDPYVPVLPEGFKPYEVTWYGSTYSVYFSDSNKASIKGDFIYCDDAEYKYWLNNMAENRLAENSSQVTHSDERNAEIYTYTSAESEYKYVYYSLSNPSNNTEVYVEETYILKSKYSFDRISDGMPNMILLCGTTELGKFVVLIYGSTLTELPSTEWLSSFGLQKYSES